MPYLLPLCPADRLVVTVTGDVLMCCNDAQRTEVMGNITRQPLEEIWFSELLREKEKAVLNPW